MRRRHALISIIATPFGLLAQPPDAPALVFVLVDTSRTIPDLNDFRSAWTARHRAAESLDGPRHRR